MSAAPKLNLFERFKRLYGLAGESDRDRSANCNEPAHGPSPDEAIATAEKALQVLTRLKSYTLPAGRIPTARMIAERCAARLVHRRDGEAVFEVDDPSSILAVLLEIEGELIALGGAPDPDLAETVALVEGIFPGSRLVGVRKPR